MSDFKKRVNKLRNGLEDSHWYCEEDEKTFEELARKSGAFEKTKIDIRKQIDHLYKNMFSEKAQTKIDLLEGILMTMNDNEFDADHESEAE